MKYPSKKSFYLKNLHSCRLLSQTVGSTCTTLLKFLVFFLGSIVFLFVWVEDLLPSQQFFSHVAMFSWVEPVLSNKDEVSCSRTQHCAPGEIRTRDLAIISPVLYQLSHNTVLPKLDCRPSMVVLVLVYHSNSWFTSRYCNTYRIRSRCTTGQCPIFSLFEFTLFF